MHDSAGDAEQLDLIEVDGLFVEVQNAGFHSDLKAFCNLHQSSRAGAPQLRLFAGIDGLHCEWLQKHAKPLKYHIDVVKFVQQQRSYPAAKQGALNQALGRKTKHILDATAGWGGDAFLMCAQGYTVTVIERNPIMALLLKDAMQRLAQTEWAQDNQVSVPAVIHVDAISFLLDQRVGFDCIYLDPMFPPKRKKSAAVNKRLKLLQWMVGEDDDAGHLLTSALKCPCARVVVKRPDNAEPLLVAPSLQYSSKLIHYDVYLNGQLNFRQLADS